MKKSILSLVAAGALAVGGAASAQSLGDIVGSILGFGGPSYNSGAYAVPPGARLYADQQGRHFYYDQYGRAVFVQPGGGSAIVGHDQWGRPVYGSAPYTGGNYAWSGQAWDRDRDGIADRRDRWPNDSRYW